MLVCNHYMLACATAKGRFLLSAGDICNTPRLARMAALPCSAGNHAFAQEYDRVVPDTWGLINDQASCLDPVWLQPRVHAWLQLVMLVMFAWAPAVWATLINKVWAMSPRK